MPPAAPNPGTTEYVVLRFDQDTDTWHEHGDHINARSADTAIRAHLDRLNNADVAGVYIAVPARSFKPVTVTVHTQTTIKLDTADA